MCQSLSCTLPRRRVELSWPQMKHNPKQNRCQSTQTSDLNNVGIIKAYIWNKLYHFQVNMVNILEICWSCMECGPESIVTTNMSNLKGPVSLWSKDLFKGWKGQLLSFVCLYIGLDEIKLSLKWNKMRSTSGMSEMLDPGLSWPFQVPVSWLKICCRSFKA